MLSNFKKIYDKLPKRYIGFIKHLPDKVVYGSPYLKWKNKISFDKSVIDTNLLDTLNYTRDNTQFGKENIPKNLELTNIRSVLESLPLVSAYDISTNLDYYISRKFNVTNSYITTTGGTGKNPTSILLSNESFGI